MKLNKLIVALMSVVSINAIADNEFRVASNKVGGYIFITHSRCVYKSTQKVIPGKYYVYSTYEDGTKGLEGCYKYRDPFYIVEWNNGSELVIHAANDTTPLK